MKTKLHKWVLIAAACIIIIVSGCAWSIGDNGHESSKHPTQPTLGKELIDLKTAMDQGAITEEEYQAQKRKLMEKQ